jgi:uroporphyrinogen-III decarboxylase
LSKPIEKIAESRSFLTRLWHLENAERSAFLIGYTGPRLKGGAPVRSALFSTEGKDTVRERLQDPKKFLAAQLEEIQGQIAFRGDFVPALCPTLGVIAIPSAFGCPVVWWENDFPSVRPLIGDDPMRVYDLAMPELTSGVLGRILDYTRFFIEQTGGQYPVRLADVQGPLDNAALIFGHTNFLEAVISSPREVHHLLQMITDFMIEFIRTQRDLAIRCGAEFVPSGFQPWIPDGFGISIANDTGVMLSPALHDEFSVPYINQLSEAFGGVYIHSCGNWTHLIPSLKKVRGLRGLEFGASETPFGSVFEHFGGRAILACRVGLHRDIKFSGMADFVSKIKKMCATYRGVFMHVDITNGLVDENWPETDLDEIYRII